MVDRSPRAESVLAYGLKRSYSRVAELVAKLLSAHDDAGLCAEAGAWVWVYRRQRSHTLPSRRTWSLTTPENIWSNTLGAGIATVKL